MKTRRVTGEEQTHNLELDGNHPEVQDLHRRPEHKVRLECRQVHILELASQGSPSATLSNRHEGEETDQTYIHFY